MKNLIKSEFGVPAVVDRDTFQTELDALRVREKAHTREGDAIAAADFVHSKKSEGGLDEKDPNNCSNCRSLVLAYSVRGE
jgi:hypothetical protein